MVAVGSLQVAAILTCALGRAGALGGAAGAGLLLLTPSDTFERIAPWLIGVASLAILARPRVHPEHSHPDTARGLAPGVFAIAIYGGYFGAAAGVMVLALMLVATGKPDSLRQSYGHWTGVVRRSRLGLVSAASNDLDGDLLGAVVPRHVPIAPRPGLAWLVSDGDAVLVQVASDAASDVAPPNAESVAV